MGALVWWAAHDWSHIFGHFFRGALAIGLVVFAITVYTTLTAGGGISIGHNAASVFALL